MYACTLSLFQSGLCRMYVMSVHSCNSHTCFLTCSLLIGPRWCQGLILAFSLRNSFSYMWPCRSKQTCIWEQPLEGESAPLSMHDISSGATMFTHFHGCTEMNRWDNQPVGYVQGNQLLPASGFGELSSLLFSNLVFAHKSASGCFLVPCRKPFPPT